MGRFDQSSRGDLVISQLKYVCLSDLHAGAETSLITHISKSTFEPDAAISSETSRALGIALRATLAEFSDEDPADLVLLGDVLDLSLSPPERTTAVFETFVQEVLSSPKGDDPIHLSETTYFLPGNHDHSLWTALRYQTEEFVDEDRKRRERRGALERFKQVTPAFDLPDERMQSSLLSQIFHAGGRTCKVPTYYPNMGLRSDDGKRAVVMHHGHFIESTYKMLSIIVAAFHGRKCGPLTADTLERENGNWIDFGWSTVGENGPIGEDVASVYQFLLTGSEEGRLQDRFAKTLASNLLKTLPLPKTKQVTEAVSVIAKGVIDATVGKFSQTERLSYTSYLGQESIEGLKDYLIGAVLDQFEKEIIGPHPEETSFIFGHTHKPFEDQIIVDGFDAPVKVFNTGGWILDTSLLGTKEGASIVFVDDEANVASLRVFNSPLNGKPSDVKVHILGEETELSRKLKSAVSKHKKHWDHCAHVIVEEMLLRQKVILKETAQADMIAAPKISAEEPFYEI